MTTFYNSMCKYRFQMGWIAATVWICLVFLINHVVVSEQDSCLCRPGSLGSNREYFSYGQTCDNVGDSPCCPIQYDYPPPMQSFNWIVNEATGTYEWTYTMNITDMNKTDDETTARIFVTLYIIKGDNGLIPVKGCINISLSKKQCFQEHCEIDKTGKDLKPIFQRERDCYDSREKRIKQNCGELELCDEFHDHWNNRLEEAITCMSCHVNKTKKKVKQEIQKNGGTCFFYFSKDEVTANVNESDKYSHLHWFNRAVYLMPFDKFAVIAAGSDEHESVVMDRGRCDLYHCRSTQNILKNGMTIRNFTVTLSKNRLICLPWNNTSGNNTILCMEPTPRNDSTTAAPDQSDPDQQLVLIVTSSVLGCLILLAVAIILCKVCAHSSKKRKKKLTQIEEIQREAMRFQIEPLGCLIEHEEVVDVFTKEDLINNYSFTDEEIAEKAFGAEFSPNYVGNSKMSGHIILEHSKHEDFDQNNETAPELTREVDAANVKKNNVDENSDYMEETNSYLKDQDNSSYINKTSFESDYSEDSESD